jgi:hypothetical protein
VIKTTSPGADRQIRGEWDDSDWKGWWGDASPYHCPVFVLTHYPHHPIEMEGGCGVLGRLQTTDSEDYGLVAVSDDAVFAMP